MFIRMVSHWAGRSLGWSLISLVSHQASLSGWSLNRLIFQAGLSSGWSLNRLVSQAAFHQAGVSGRFFIRLVSQAGFSSGRSLRLDPEGRPGMSDVCLLSGISGLSFDSPFLSPFLFFLPSPFALFVGSFFC